MKTALRWLLLVCCGLLIPETRAQERLLTAGFQYKPIFASRFFGSGTVESLNAPLLVRNTPTWGHSFGMVIRRGFTRSISYETGINYIRRNYRMEFYDLETDREGSSEFGIVSYEIPNQCLVYVRLGDRVYMNNAFGVSITAFASSVESSSKDRRFHQVSRMNTRWFALALTGNVGFEYRTEKSGFFYLGGSLHWPFNDIARTRVNYERNNLEIFNTTFNLKGSFLTIDLRYFFHSDPIRREKNRTKKK